MAQYQIWQIFSFLFDRGQILWESRESICGPVPDLIGQVRFYDRVGNEALALNHLRQIYWQSREKSLGPQPYLRPGMKGMMTESGKQLWPWTWARCVRFDDRVGKAAGALYNCTWSQARCDRSDDRVGKEAAALNQVLGQVLIDLMTESGKKLRPLTRS